MKPNRARLARGRLSRRCSYGEIRPPLRQFLFPDSFDGQEFFHALERAVRFPHLQNLLRRRRPDAGHFLQLRRIRRIDINRMPRRFLLFSRPDRNQTRGADEKDKQSQGWKPRPHRARILPILRNFSNNLSGESRVSQSKSSRKAQLPARLPCAS